MTTHPHAARSRDGRLALGRRRPFRRFHVRVCAILGGVVAGMVLGLSVVRAGPDEEYVSAPRCQIDLISGESFEASGLELAATNLLANVDGAPRTVPLPDVASIAFIRDSTSSASNGADGSADHAVLLVDGSNLTGTIRSAGERAPGQVILATTWHEPIMLPFTALAGICLQRSGSAEYEDRLARREQGRDLILLAREGKILAVPSAVESIIADQCEFRVGRKLQAAPLESIVGIVFGSQPLRKPSLARVALLGGDVLRGSLVAIRAERVSLNHELLGSMDIPSAAVQRIDLASDRVVSLVDLEPATTQIKSVLDAPWSVGRNANLRGQPLMIRGRSFSRGLGVHAYTSLSYDLSQPYEAFTATVGVDDSAPDFASVVFRVKLDGRVVYESPVMRRGDGPLRVKVKLAGARVLELVCDPTDDLDLGDHAIWGAPVLVKPRSPVDRSDD